MFATYQGRWSHDPYDDLKLGDVYLFFLLCSSSYPFDLRKGLWGRLASIAAWTGIIAQTVALILRWKASYDLKLRPHPPFELIRNHCLLRRAIVAVNLFIEWRTKTRAMGTFIVLIAFLGMAYASISPGISDRIQPLIPALQSNWLTSHVVTCFMGYAAFAVAFGCGVIYLLRERVSARHREFMDRLPDVESLDEMIYRSTALGFVFSDHRHHDRLHLGSLCRGSYWSWNPKEYWSLITWIIYAIMLHARFVRIGGAGVWR